MRVAVLDDYLDSLRRLRCFDALADHEVEVFTDYLDALQPLAARLACAHALVLIRERTAIGRELLESLPELRLISQRSAYPHIDVEACTELGIVVSSHLHAAIPSYAAAELTWALVLASSRRLPEQVNALRSGRWQTATGRTLRGRTLGIYGFGRIGEVVASYGRSFGMEVLVWGGQGSRERAAAAGYGVACSKAAFFETCDVLSLHLRLVAATQGIVTARDRAPDANRRPPREHQPGRADRARGPGRGPAGRTSGQCRRRCVRAGARGRSRRPLAGHGGSPVHPPPRLRHRRQWEIQFADVFDQINAYAARRPTNVVNPGVLDRLRPWVA